MVFSSTIFLAWFLPIFMSLYLLADSRYKNMVILAGSLVFYAWGAPKFIFLVLLTTFIDFHLVRWMDSETGQRRKQLLLASLGLNLGLLLVFKYTNFLVDNLNTILAGAALGPIPLAEIALPLGVSFFVFESITYVVDVYRGVHKPLRNFWDYQMYILMFPKMIAGPIVRYHELAGQIQSRTHSPDLFLSGFIRFCVGLGKKVIIANTLGAASKVFLSANAGQLAAWEAWIAFFAFTMQVYFDFSGYSDMALGLGRMMGFRLPENFNNPFVARSLTEFWRRWHITLGNWMRDYLYVPLGGNRMDEPRLVYRNLAIVFLASGLWHGASWNFVIWGAWHGLWLILERMFLNRWLARMPKPIGMLYTTLVVVLGIGFFFIEDLGHALHFYGALFGGGEGIGFAPGRDFWIMGGLALIFAWFAAIPGGAKVQAVLYGEAHPALRHALLLTGAAALFVLSLSIVDWTAYNPFLYFRF